MGKVSRTAVNFLTHFPKKVISRVYKVAASSEIPVLVVGMQMQCKQQ